MIRRIGIVGAGSMGSAIAGLAASAGLDVVLLDVKGDDDPDAPARRGLERALASRAFLDPDAVSRITVGNVEDDLDRLAGCDWILEAIVERHDAKVALLRDVAAVAPARAAITTNTSTFTLSSLSPDDSARWRERFYATHFFNPPRALLLVEVACLPGAEEQRFHAFARFLERRFGRRLLVVRDTPGFVANRFGIYALVHAIRLTEELGLTIEDVDALTGPLLGRPRSATFRTVDLTGLDILVLGTASLGEATGDDYRLPAWVEGLYTAGRLGDKTGGGFYRRDGDQQLTLDIASGAYRLYREPEIPGLQDVLGRPLRERLQRALALPDPYGAYVRALLGRTFAYVLDRAPDVSPDVPTVDRALEWGFGWASGPFGQMDMLGIETTVELVAGSGAAEPDLLRRARRYGSFYLDGSVLDVQSDATVRLDRVTTARRTAQATAWSELERQGTRTLDEGVVALRVTRLDDLPKMLEATLQAAVPQAVVLVPRLDGLGYPYVQALEVAAAEDWNRLDALFVGLQQAFEALAGSPVPVVTALEGSMLGAATTLALWSDRVVAYVTTVPGFPEVGAGFLPFGAVTALLLRAYRTVPAAPGPGSRSMSAASLSVFGGVPNWSSLPAAPRGRAVGLLSDADVVTLDRDGLLDLGCQVAATLAASTWVRPAALPVLDETAREVLVSALVGGTREPGLPGEASRALAELAQAIGRGETVTEAVSLERDAWTRMLREKGVRERLYALVERASARRR